MPSKTDSTEVSPSEAPTFSTYLRLLKNRIDLRRGPFSDRGSRLMAFHQDNYFDIRLAERWFKREGQLAGYRDRPPLIDDWHLPMAKAGACRYR